MSDWLKRIEEARAAGDPRPLLERVPYARSLGIFIEAREGGLLARMPFAEHLVGDSSIPALHGGTLGALLESVAICTVMWSADEARLPRTVNLTVDYLRSGRAKETFAAATIIRAGRRVVVARATAWQDDREAPIAAANLHFLITPR